MSVHDIQCVFVCVYDMGVCEWGGGEKENHVSAARLRSEYSESCICLESHITPCFIVT